MKPPVDLKRELTKLMDSFEKSKQVMRVVAVAQRNEIEDEFARTGTVLVSGV